jgi:hypothetical protein
MDADGRIPSRFTALRMPDEGALSIEALRNFADLGRLVAPAILRGMRLRCWLTCGCRHSPLATWIGVEPPVV